MTFCSKQSALGVTIVSSIVLIFYVFLQLLMGGGFITGGAVLKQYAYLDNPKYKQYLEEVIKGVETIKYLDEIPHTLPYELTKDTTRTVHIGQLKLFLTEVEFLTEKLAKHDEQVVMIYAGSAPCMHASFLSEMFPNLKIVCVDPNEHIIYYPNYKSSYDHQYLNKTVYFKATLKNMYRSHHRNIQMYDFQSKSIKKLKKELNVSDIEHIGSIFDSQIERKNYSPIIDFIQNTNYKYYIIEDYFTDGLAELFAVFGEGNFLFCSDIRTKEGTLKYPGDIDLLWNLAMQYNWLNIMQPAHCMLKFRCPFFENEDRKQFTELCENEPYNSVFIESKKLGIDFVSDYKANKFQYIKPDRIYIQAFPGFSSSESRLIASKYNDIVEYDYLDYQERFFYYNMVLRPYGYHSGYLTDKNMAFDSCADCALTYQIMLEYYQKFKPKNANPKFIKIQISALMQLLRRKFNEHNSVHGQYLEKYKDISDIP